VAIAEIDAPASEETAHLAGNEAIAIRTDVTDPDSLQSAIRATVDKFGRIEVLHNNAGGSTAQDDTAVNAPLSVALPVARQLGPGDLVTVTFGGRWDMVAGRGDRASGSCAAITRHPNLMGHKSWGRCRPVQLPSRPTSSTYHRSNPATIQTPPSNSPLPQRQLYWPPSTSW
jgi:hypothetical protein